MRTTTTFSLILVTSLGLSACGSMGARRQLVRTEPICQDTTVPIYFEPNQAAITRDGRRVIAAAAAEARGCDVQAVRVLGLADAAGDPQANLELSKRRAEAVIAALHQAKLPSAEIDPTAAGDAGSVNKKGQIRPVRRRVDIVLKLSKPK